MWISFYDVESYKHENSTIFVYFKDILKVIHIIHSINNMNILI